MIKEMIRNNLWLKVAALVLAIILWLFVIFRTQAEVSMEVEPRIKNAPGDMCVMDQKPSTINIVLRGNENFLQRLKPSDVRVSVYVQEPRRGRVYVPIKKENVKLPPHTYVVGLNPAGIWLTLEEKTKTVLPIKPQIIGEPAKGFVVERIETDPDVAEIECAREELKSIYTEPVDISGENRTVEQEVALRGPEKSTGVSPEQVKVKVFIKRRTR